MAPLNSHHMDLKVALFLIWWMTTALPMNAQTDTSEAVSQIRRAGAIVVENGDGLEIDFHLKGRNSADALLPSVGTLKAVVWLITDSNQNALGYFVAKDDDALAMIPKSAFQK